VEAVISLLEGLTGAPAIESHLPPDKSFEELRAAAQATFTGLWGRIHEMHASGASSTGSV
jgi:hypothetical protein